MIVITGAGIISAIGVGKEATLASLREGRSGIGPIHYLKTSHTEFPVGEVPLSDSEMEHLVGIAEGTPTTRTSLMGMIALKEAVAEAGLTSEQVSQAAFISGTTVGGMDKSEQYYLDFIDNDRFNAYISTHDCGACTEMIASAVGQFAQQTTLSTACSSAANAIIAAAERIAHGECEVAIAGGSECITKFHLNGFNTLRILDTEPCRPFDATRQGLNLGEGAAYIVLESEESALRRGAKVIARLEGYGNACDAYHQTASSPEGDGAYLAMQAALRMGGTQPSEVDYINAHGTGTPNNDPSEYAAMRRLFGENVPPFSSTKSMTGHTTSASGSIEAVICLLAMQHSLLPPNLGWSQPMEEGIRPVLKGDEGKTLRRVLCNSFGFGGNDSSLLLAAPDVQPSRTRLACSAEDRPVYVVAAQQISTQQPLCDDWITSPTLPSEDLTRAIDPDFSRFIPPLEARRMGKILKRAVATAEAALEEAGMNSVDACITGTGLGCIENTEYFLDALCRNGEELLKPTHFMQSTHNTISSLISIKHHLHGYNATYAHGTLSFDSALDDALRQIRTSALDTALVAGHDEMTPSYYKLLCKSGYLGHKGQTAGESAVSIILGTQKEGSLCRLGGTALLYKPSPDELRRQTLRLMQEAGVSENDIAGLMTSVGSDPETDRRLRAEAERMLPGVPLLHYKHLFGESYTASALGFYVCATCLSHGCVPATLRVEADAHPIANPHALVLLNSLRGNDYAITLLVATPNPSRP